MRVSPIARLAVFFGVLVSALVLQLRPTAKPLLGRGVHLAQVFAVGREGWESHDLQLGPNEALTGEVAKVLRYDDVFFREYSRAGVVRFSLYIAYWNPGTIPVQLVASHTPDRCWAENGWSCLESEFDTVLTIGGRRLRPAQGRVFRDPAGNVQRVYYWHMVGDELYDYGHRSNTVPDAFRWVREAARQALGRPEEQYFVRLASDRTIESLDAEPGFAELVGRLASLGLVEKKV